MTTFQATYRALRALAGKGRPHAVSEVLANSPSTDQPSHHATRDDGRPWATGFTFERQLKVTVGRQYVITTTLQVLNHVEGLSLRAHASWHDSDGEHIAWASYDISPATASALGKKTMRYDLRDRREEALLYLTDSDARLLAESYNARWENIYPTDDEDWPTTAQAQLRQDIVTELIEAEPLMLCMLCPPDELDLRLVRPEELACVLKWMSRQPETIRANQ